MKIGTFVGQQSIPFTDEEITTMVTRFKDAIEYIFPNAKVTFSHKEDDYPCLIITAHNVTPSGKFRVYSTADSHFIRYKDLIFPTGDISIQLFSSMGYDEAETGPCYKWEEMGHPKDWKPEFNKHSYSLYTLWHGSHKAYRHQYKDGLEVKGHYHYGTELSDLDFEKNLEVIASIVKTMKKEK